MLRPAIDEATAAASDGPRVCALLTCFNRREQTLSCLQSLELAAASAHARLHAVLVDDASTDGTAQAVRSRYRWVEVESGDGTLFWCRGMNRAMTIGLAQGHDFYLWLNDDTILHEDSLQRLLSTEETLRRTHGSAPIVVGCTVDATSGGPSYGGTVRESAWLPTRFTLVTPGHQPQRCDTMNGNIVLMAHEIPARLGNLDPHFEHAMGDTDYGLRARSLGIGVWAAPGVHGNCSDNSRRGTFLDRNLPLRERWRRAMSRKGLPWRSWLRLTRRHAGWIWPLYFVWPYLQLVAQGLAARPRPARQERGRP